MYRRGPVSAAPDGFEARLELPAFSGKGCLAAVSGGADSTAMLVALAARRDCGPPFDLRCMHVNHGLRGAEADADALFVEALCDALRVPFVLGRVPPGALRAAAARSGEGIEAEARRARYALLRREAARSGAGVVVTAHTRDDLLETVLMRVLRGAGPAGLSPLRRRRGIIRRPLIGLYRADALRYLEERGQVYRADSSNRDEAYARNRLRRRLIPVLDAHFPGWKSALWELSETQYRVGRFLARRARAALRPLEDGAVRVRRAGALDPAVGEEALFLAIDRLARAERGAGGALTPDIPARGPRAPRRKALRRLLESGARAAVTGGALLVRERDGSVLVRPAPAAAPPEERALVLESAGRLVVFTRAGADGEPPGGGGKRP